VTDDSTSIDDLLRFEEEPPAKARRESRGAGWWVRTVLIAGALTAVTVFALRLFGFAIPIVAVAAGYLALLALRRVTSSLSPEPAPRSSRRSSVEDGSYNFNDRDALRAAVARWERLLQRAGSDVGSARATHRTLVEIADERLRQRHSVTRAGDPPRARTLLGEPLWNYLSTPPTRNLSPRDASAHVQQLERL
jgi:hypothetical protein